MSSHFKQILECKQVTIHKEIHNNCKVKKYTHEESTFKLAKIHPSSEFVYNGNLYEITNDKGETIYTGPLAYNTDTQCVEPAIVVGESEVKVVFNLGTSITGEQKASTLVNIFDRINLPTKQKLMINGPGSDLSNPMAVIPGQIGGHGISDNVKNGVDFMQGAGFVFNAGFSRGAITTTLQINSATQQSPTTKFHVVELDPVAGALFDTYQLINPLFGAKNLGREAKQLNEKNIIGGTVLYSQEVTPGFNPTVYKGNNYGTFVVDTNHQNIDGVDAGQVKIPGFTKLKREANLQASNVVQSMLEKQLLLYGIGILGPTYVSAQDEFEMLKKDQEHKQFINIIKTPVIPGAGLLGNSRENLLQGVQNLRDEMDKLIQSQDDEYK